MDEIKMDKLPELAFEEILRQLALEEILKLRAVSRECYQRIDNFRVSSLCFSMKQSGFIRGKSRWVNGAFARNFISFSRFTSRFFDTFGQTILSNLRHLRFCDLKLSKGNETAFTCTLNSFDRLERLDIIRTEFNQQGINLNLPMLTSLHLENVYGIRKLTLEAPRLREIKIRNRFESNLEVEIVYGESVERLLVDQLRYMEVKKLKNLQYLYVKNFLPIDTTFLSSLPQLKEINLQNESSISDLFRQKQRYGRAELKIYFKGRLLSGPQDPAISLLQFFNRDSLPYLAENPFALSDEIPFYDSLCYEDIEHIGLGLEMNILGKFTHLKRINVDHSIQDSQRFLNILKNLGNIEELNFVLGQPQDLFNRLPEHSAVQRLAIFGAPSDFRFLLRMKHLIELSLNCSIDAVQTVRNILEKLLFLSHFHFHYDKKYVRISRDLKQFTVSIEFGAQKNIADLNGSIQFIEENLQGQGANSLE